MTNLLDSVLGRQIDLVERFGGDHLTYFDQVGDVTDPAQLSQVHRRRDQLTEAVCAVCGTTACPSSPST